MHGFRATDVAWELPTEDAYERLTLLAIARWADDSLKAYPSQVSICKATGMNIKTLGKALNRLVARGLVSVSKGKNNANEYRLTENGMTENGMTENGMTENGMTENGQTVYPNSDKRYDQIRADGMTKFGQQTDKEQIKEQTKEQSERKRTASRAFVPAEVESGEVDAVKFRDWQTIRKAKRAPLSETAWSLFKAEASKAGFSLNEALDFCIAGGFQGFRASWESVKEHKKAVEKNKPRVYELDGVIYEDFAAYGKALRDKGYERWKKENGYA